MNIRRGKLYNEKVILDGYQVQVVSECTYQGYYQSSKIEKTGCTVIAANGTYFTTLSQPLLQKITSLLLVGLLLPRNIFHHFFVWE